MGGVLALALLPFVSCSDTREDDSLVVTITSTGDTKKTVTMAVTDSSYDGEEVHIVYTTDGSEPTVKYDAEAEETYYVDYGTAAVYTEALTFDSDTVINAKAFYIKNEKAYVGPLATAELTFEVSSTTEDAPANEYGTLTFKLASSGNSLQTHYFDTSDKTFTYNSTEHCYYQFLFSYKGSSKGNWYLFVRQLGASNPVVVDGQTNKYLAKGTFTGACFNDYQKGKVANGELTLLTDKGNAFGDTATMTGAPDTPTFTFEIQPETRSTAVSDTEK